MNSALTREEINQSRESLLAEGFHKNSLAIYVHDQLLMAMDEIEALQDDVDRQLDINATLIKEIHEQTGGANEIA